MKRQQLQGQPAERRVAPPEPGHRHAACVVRRTVKLVPNAFALALAMVLFGPAASAQSCPPSEFGKSCGPFGSPFPGLPQWVGVCIAATCSSQNLDDGAVSQQPCGFCEPVACPVPEIGQPCDAGTCTQATCRGTDDAGNASSQACGVCIVPIPGCSSANLGAPCANGGTCMTGTVRAKGPAGAAPPSDLVYSTPECVVPLTVPDGGDLDVDASISATPQAADGAASAPGADASSGDAATSSRGSGSGCDVAAGRGLRTRYPRGIGLLFAAAALLVAMKRRRSAAGGSSAPTWVLTLVASIRWAPRSPRPVRVAAEPHACRLS
jgi:hypothetical protein